MLDYAFGAGEYYESVDDILQDDSLLEVDMAIRGLKKRVRIRALTFLQMEKINQQSAKGTTNEIDNVEFTVNTIVEGLVRPKLNQAQARKLMEANGEVVRELAENIWALGKVSKDVFDKYIEALQKDNKIPEPEPSERDSSVS